MVKGDEVEIEDSEDRTEKALDLPQREMKEQAYHQCGLNRKVRVVLLTTWATGWCAIPGLHGLW